MPSDLTLLHVLAIGLIFLCWFGYSAFMHRFAEGSLNSQLEVVRRSWLLAATRRETKPFDAILLGHIINSIAFFGSATLLVLAGVLSLFINLKAIHATESQLGFTTPISLQLFALEVGLLAFVLAVCFFSFTYSLRKLIYTIALIGALPAANESYEEQDALVTAAARVLSEAITTFNLGIRGYYYAIATLCLLISPWVSIAATAIVTVVLVYRQLATPTAAAVKRYVEAAKSLDE